MIAETDIVQVSVLNDRGIEPLEPRRELRTVFSLGFQETLNAFFASGFAGSIVGNGGLKQMTSFVRF
jgi:hypothetical protein